jgi:hypothetical protein
MSVTTRVDAFRLVALLATSLVLASCITVAAALPAQSPTTAPSVAATTPAPVPTPLPSITADPMGIVVASLRSLSTLRTVHMSMVMFGQVSGDLLQLGTADGVLRVDGVTAETDVDMRRPAVSAHLDAKSLMGIRADVISIGSDTWVRTSIGGSLWSKTAPVGTPWPTAILQLEPLLRSGSVKAYFVGSETCGTDICDKVMLITTSTALPASQSVSAQVSVRRSDELPIAVEISMREKLPNDQPQLFFSVKVALSRFDEPVSIQAPDPSQVSSRQPFGIPTPSTRPAPVPVGALDCAALEEIVLENSPVNLARTDAPQPASVPKESCVFLQDPLPIDGSTRVASLVVSPGSTVSIPNLMSIYPDGEKIDGIGDFAWYTRGQIAARKDGVSLVAAIAGFPTTADPKHLLTEVMRAAMTAPKNAWPPDGDPALTGWSGSSRD